MITKIEKLQHTLANAIKSGNKGKAVAAIIELTRLGFYDEPAEIQPIKTGEVFCFMNADKNLVFGYYEIQFTTEKALQVNGVWIPRKAVKQEVVDGTQVIRFKHWFEPKLGKSDLDNIDQDKLALHSLQIDKSRQEKIEVPMLIKYKEDGSFIKLFFIKVSDTLVRIRQCEGIDYLFIKNFDWLTGAEEAKMFYYNMSKYKKFKLQKTKFADY